MISPIFYLESDSADYYNEGAMDLVTLRDNVAAYNRYKIIPRILRNVSNIDTSTTIFGQRVEFPLGFSPSAMQKLAHQDGELATSRAAAAMGVAMCLSSYSNTSLEEVISVGNGNPYMIQMCVVKDRSITAQLLRRAEVVQKAAGYKAIFMSVDVPVLGRRLNEMRNDFTLPAELMFPNILSTGYTEFSETDGERHNYDASLEWEEIIPWLKRNTKMEVWLKGVLSPADVELAIKYGVHGILVSNHGGRQLDGVPATLDALRDCAVVARGRIQTAVDGGIRRGSDIFKALALGARHCFIGRIAIWGLAYNGQKGVELALKILLAELQVTMALAGCRTVDEITIEHLAVLKSNGLLSKL
ncbi:hypothetical protein H2200_010314 [Cladophialophora chaetospira]|uniref:Oxidase FUB9 n=1 Tax=Cladophialophora chaetospira TaxID=386627 RepID=A0AA39CE13_9EURO|nr:hypothetical protein H2200_010314 [Cladophialophora chaetospira]